MDGCDDQAYATELERDIYLYRCDESTLMRLIPAHNATEQRKVRARPSGQNDYWRIASFAKRYRNGEITAEDVPPEERDDVMMYLLAHPRRKAIA